MDVPVTESEVPTAIGIMKSETISDQPAGKNESIASSRPKRGSAKNEGVVGKKSQAPVPSSDEEPGFRERCKRKCKSETKGDSESPNKKADMANCFGFESDVSRIKLYDYTK